jgi:cellulose synthase/poly-beta-1,6-N-acetylglucosamine synthase-like glycosyltransferase
MIADIISIIIICLLILPFLYLLILAVASIRLPSPVKVENRIPSMRFIVAIPAHNEENVIGSSLKWLKELDYPADLYSIHVIVDHSTDKTAEIARMAGAVVYELNDGKRSGKGNVLTWFLDQALDKNVSDAIVIFDADTRVDAAFLRVMDVRLSQGAKIIQGQHIISNPEAGWFSLLTWAMFIVDNRFQNLGRTNLGWSAKNMGDSICISTGLLKEISWGEGLTEDYQLRQQLLLAGYRIFYEPAAKAYGEAPAGWAQAQAQRARWLKGTVDASRGVSWQMLIKGVKHFNSALLDGAAQSFFPSYSTLATLYFIIVSSYLIISIFFASIFSWYKLLLFGSGLFILFIYPLFGLALERAPFKAYFILVISGPIYIIWRTVLAIKARFGRQPITWVRTKHGN